MDFVGRADPLQRLQASLLGADAPRPLSIVSVSGPGGVGKTYLLRHALAVTDLSRRELLRLRLGGADRWRSLADLITVDLPESAIGIENKGKAHFALLRSDRTVLARLDDEARREIASTAASDPTLRESLDAIFSLGVGVQELLPFTKKYVSVARAGKYLPDVERAALLLQRAKAYQQEGRVLNGILPDVLGAGQRNRLRANLAATLADDLVADLSAILVGYRDKERHKPLPAKVPGLTRLLLVLDDYESLQPVIEPFLVDHLVPQLATAGFETLLVVVGRDRLVDTHAAWRQQFEPWLAGELRLTSFSPAEAEEYVRLRGIDDPAAVHRILTETEGYPYLLAGEVEAELEGGRSALALKGFYERTTRWMTTRQRNWFLPLCFLDEINAETIALMLPGEPSAEVLEWFKNEASIRSPTAKKWTVLPIIRSRMQAYVQNDSPERFRELGERAADARPGGEVAAQ
jgi:hypothetical protein